MGTWVRREWVITLLTGVIIGLLVGVEVVRHIPERDNPIPLDQVEEVTAAFHRVYHNNWFDRTLMNTYWLGVQTMKCPLDAWVFQEIIFETEPDVIIETGTRTGGSALFFASMLDLLNRGRVLTVDIVEYPDKRPHPRVQYFHGSSTSKEIHTSIAQMIQPGEKVMVFLDSDHSKSHVLMEMELYGPLVSLGCYMIVEDTHLNGHPIYTKAVNPGPGPMEAVQEYLAKHRDFMVDENREKYGLTFNPNGFLKKTD